MVYKKSLGEKAFDVFNILLLTIGTFVFLYPLWFVLISSLSSAAAIASGSVILWPEGINFDAYKRVFFR